jgi:hypothetical protein
MVLASSGPAPELGLQHSLSARRRLLDVVAAVVILDLKAVKLLLCPVALACLIWLAPTRLQLPFGLTQEALLLLLLLLLLGVLLPAALLALTSSSQRKQQLDASSSCSSPPALNHPGDPSPAQRIPGSNAAPAATAPSCPTCTATHKARSVPCKPVEATTAATTVPAFSTAAASSASTPCKLRCYSTPPHGSTGSLDAGQRLYRSRVTTRSISIKVTPSSTICQPRRADLTQSMRPVELPNMSVPEASDNLRDSGTCVGCISLESVEVVS